MSHNLSANLRCGVTYQDHLFVIFRWLLPMCPEGRTLLPRIPWDRKRGISTTLSPRWNTAGWRLGEDPVSDKSGVCDEGRCHERGEREPGTAFLFALSQEFGKSVDWLLTGKEHAAKRKRVAKDVAGLGCDRAE
jgi:hypothetical protein